MKSFCPWKQYLKSVRDAEIILPYAAKSFSHKFLQLRSPLPNKNEFLKSLTKQFKTRTKKRNGIIYTCRMFKISILFKPISFSFLFFSPCKLVAKNNAITDVK